MKRNALGRGLDSLISMDDIQTGGSSAITEIAIEQITPNPDQPRTTFDETALEELAVSIRELGIIQPLTLRSVGTNAYQIISGERRYRAAKLAGLRSVPAYVRTAGDTEVTEMALIENIQREDLNAIEIAVSYKRLLDECNLSQDELSAKVGKNKTTI
ncbi:MAG: ParB/RepB/Spo0J family partition protein, partial [Muribaculaceae bacterium]|nr:ParB/RepB/Spo0J family partition protein [Muribaculaceae bacterium]